MQLSRLDVWLLDYCLTSNHVHLLLDAEERLEISRLMRNVVGQFARDYNRRKARPVQSQGHCSPELTVPYQAREIAPGRINPRVGEVGAGTIRESV